MFFGGFGLVRGKPWTVGEEKQLNMMLQEGRSVRAIARVLGKTRDCVRMKVARLGLEVVVQSKSHRTTTKLTLPEDRTLCLPVLK